MRIPPFTAIPVLILCFTASSCTSDPTDPTRALPANAGIVLSWQPGAAVPRTGFPDLDTAIHRLVTAIPTRDSLAPVPYAAFAYNLRPGELGAGLAVATEQLRAINRRRTDIDYRGITLYRIDSTRLLSATYGDLTLMAPEAVIIQEMVDQLLEGPTPDAWLSSADPTVQVLRYTLPELGALLSSQTTEAGRIALAQWAADWQTLELRFDHDTLLDWQLTPTTSRSAAAAIDCLPSIPAGIDHFVLLPVPRHNRSAGISVNWSTYVAPWLGDTYGRIATDNGVILALCPRDERLMGDLLDRLERDFAVAERISYPNGTILRTEAPDLTALLPFPLSKETWLLRTKEQTYLARNAPALEKVLDLQLLAGPQSLPAAINSQDSLPVMLARLNTERMAKQMNAAFPGWHPPGWWPNLAGWWRGTTSEAGVTLRQQPNAPTGPEIKGVEQPSIKVAWRWEAPASIESIITVPGTAQCAVYLQDGSLIILNEELEEQIRIQLGAAPNSPVYQLPATSGRSPCWLFSTPTAVYLIDTAGRAIPGFPYRPAGGLATGIALDDLDRAANPAYFVPLRTGRIEAYSLRGLPLVNWAVPADMVAAAPLITLHSDTHTYLAAVDTLSRVRVYDRGGREYLTFDSLPAPLIAPLSGQLSPSTGAGRLVTLELNGRIRVMSLAGGHFPLRTVLPNGAPRQLLFTDLWGDRRKDYLVSRAETAALYAYEDQAFAQRWQAEFPMAVERVFTLPSLRLVGGLDRSRGLLYLLNGRTGKLLDAQGLAGRLPGQEWIRPDGTTLMITAYRRTLYAYQIKISAS